MALLEAWCKRLSGRSLQVLLVDGQNIIVQSNNNFFVVAKLEVVLDDMIFVLLDFVLVNFALLDLGQIPSDDELTTRSNDRILILAFDEVKPSWRERDFVAHVCNML